MAPAAVWRMRFLLRFIKCVQLLLMFVLPCGNILFSHCLCLSFEFDCQRSFEFGNGIPRISQTHHFNSTAYRVWLMTVKYSCCLCWTFYVVIQNRLGSICHLFCFIAADSSACTTRECDTMDDCEDQRTTQANLTVYRHSSKTIWNISLLASLAAIRTLQP